MKKEKASVYAKRIQCVLGLFFLIPSVLGVIAFVLCLIGVNGEFVWMSNLSSEWTTFVRCGQDMSGLANTGGGGGASSAPIYLGLMAIVGSYLIKDNLKYLFTNED